MPHEVAIEPRAASSAYILYQQFKGGKELRFEFGDYGSIWIGDGLGTIGDSASVLRRHGGGSSSAAG
jgi:hypothetical protein